MGYIVSGSASRRNIYEGLNEAVNAGHMVRMSCTSNLVREVDVIAKYVTMISDNKVGYGRGSNLSQAIESASNNFLYGVQPNENIKGSISDSELEQIDNLLILGAEVKIEKQLNNWIYTTISAPGRRKIELATTSVEEGLKKLDKELLKNKTNYNNNATKHGERGKIR